MREVISNENGLYTVRGKFHDQENEILFQSPLEDDLQQFINENRLCVDLVDASELKDLENVPGKTQKKISVQNVVSIAMKKKHVIVGVKVLVNGKQKRILQ